MAEQWIPVSDGTPPSLFETHTIALPSSLTGRYRRYCGGTVARFEYPLTGTVAAHNFIVRCRGGTVSAGHGAISVPISDYHPAGVGLSARARLHLFSAFVTCDPVHSPDFWNALLVKSRDSFSSFPPMVPSCTN